MTKWMKGLCVLFVLSATLFCSVGYAAVTGSLMISGQVDVEPPNAVYIIEVLDIQYSKQNFVVREAPKYIDFPSTKFLSDLTFPNANDNVTFKVRVVNRTNVTQYFNGVIVPEGLEGYGYNYDGFIKSTSGGKTTYYVEVSDHGKAIDPGKEHTFTITMTYKGSASNAARKTLFELAFTPDAEQVTQQVAESVLTAYDKLINNTAEYEKLYADGLMEFGVSGGWGGGEGYGRYIANSAAFTDKQIKAVNDALGNVMTVEINGQETKISALLKEEDVCTWNNTSGMSNRQKEERMIYFTADPLDDSGNDKAPVFVCVFYKEEDGQWISVGQDHLPEGVKYLVLEGTAPVCARQGGTGTGNFDTNDWVSAKEYFGVAKGSSLKNIMAQLKPTN